MVWKHRSDLHIPERKKECSPDGVNFRQSFGIWKSQNVSGKHIIERMPCHKNIPDSYLNRNGDNGLYFIGHGALKEIWHYIIVPNLFFYLLKIAVTIGYNKHIRKRLIGQSYLSKKKKDEEV